MTRVCSRDSREREFPGNEAKFQFPFPGKFAGIPGNVFVSINLVIFITFMISVGFFSEKPSISVFFCLILPFRIIIVLNCRHHIFEKAPHSIFHNMLKVKISCLSLYNLELCRIRGKNINFVASLSSSAL